MHKLSKKQRKALRTNNKRLLPLKLKEHRQRISNVMNRGRKDHAVPRYFWSYKW